MVKHWYNAYNNHMLPELSTDRRQGPDIWLKVMKIFGMISWCFLITALYFFDQAQPRIETLFDRWLNVSLRANWDRTFLQTMFFLILAVFYLSGAGLIINTRRHKRDTDRYSLTLIFLLLTSMLGVIIYIFYL